MRGIGFAAASVAWTLVTVAAEVCRRAELAAFHRRQRAHTAAHTGR